MPNKWLKVGIQTRLIEDKQIYSAVTSDLKLFKHTYPQIWKKANIYLNLWSFCYLLSRLVFSYTQK
jgi:hypothetical protein